MATIVPRASTVICEEGSHLCMWDAQAYYFEQLLKFLKTV
jgi:proline iminopeptidase